MATAPVGDDQFGEDPTVAALQERVAALLDKEAALFVPSGHMANQLALKRCCAPGDDVLLDPDAVETNIVVLRLAPGAPDADTVVARAAEPGVLVMAFAPRTVRAVTHLDVTRAGCERAAEVLAEAIAG